MLDPGEAAWLREQALDGARARTTTSSSAPRCPGCCRTSCTTRRRGTPRCAGASAGARWARFGENLRRRGRPGALGGVPRRPSTALAELIAEAGSGPRGAGDGVRAVGGRAPRVRRRADLARGPPGPDARVLQLTCSPVHNSIPALDTARLPLRLEPGRARARAGASPGTAGCGRPPVNWRKTGGPWFGNQLMTLTLRGRSARLRLDQAREAGRRGRTARLDARRSRSHDTHAAPVAAWALRRPGRPTMRRHPHPVAGRVIRDARLAQRSRDASHIRPSRRSRLGPAAPDGMMRRTVRFRCTPRAPRAPHRPGVPPCAATAAADHAPRRPSPWSAPVPAAPACWNASAPPRPNSSRPAPG